MKKIIKYVFIVFLVLLLLLYLRCYVFPTTPEHMKNMVLSREDDYNRIAKLIYDDYKNSGELEAVYPISSSGGLYRIDGESFNYENIDLELNDIEQRSLHIISSEFWVWDKGLDAIRAYDKYVSFCTINGMGSVVYSVDGSRPKYVNAPGESRKNVICCKINKHWYYMEEGWQFHEVLYFLALLMLEKYLHVMIIVVVLIIILTYYFNRRKKKF